jgi:RNA polymerase sigma factor (sigma-70 family)
MERVALDVAAIIDREARNVHKRYKEHVEFDDLQGEGWLYVYSHPSQVNAYKEFEKPSLAAWWLSRDLWKALDRYARRERSSQLGYEPDDEQFYAAGVIAKFMPSVLANDPTPPVSAVQEIRSSGDPAEGGEWLAAYLDVKQSYEAVSLTGNERLSLTLTFRDGVSQEALGDALGVDQKTAGRTVVRALQKLSEGLGGPAPGECPASCECRKS